VFFSIIKILSYSLSIFIESLTYFILPTKILKLLNFFSYLYINTTNKEAGFAAGCWFKFFWPANLKLSEKFKNTIKREGTLNRSAI
jgi:hypothetical protein